MTDKQDQIPPKPSAWQLLVSLLGAIFGVQSSKVRERDFVHGHAWWVYAILGFLMVLLIVLLLMGTAKLILVLAR